MRAVVAYKLLDRIPYGAMGKWVWESGTRRLRYRRSRHPGRACDATLFNLSHINSRNYLGLAIGRVPEVLTDLPAQRERLNPDSDTFANKVSWSTITGMGARPNNWYMMRYIRGGTKLAEGKFHMVR